MTCWCILLGLAQTLEEYLTNGSHDVLVVQGKGGVYRVVELWSNCPSLVLGFHRFGYYVIHKTYYSPTAVC